MLEITSAAACDLKHIFAGNKAYLCRPEWHAGGSKPASYGNSTLTEMERVSMSDAAISRHPESFLTTRTFPGPICLSAIDNQISNVYRRDRRWPSELWTTNRAVAGKPHWLG